MSFGFGVGDFVGAAQLAWDLYRYCYKVAKGAPKEFQILLGEITTLSQSIRLLEEEAKDPNSTLVRAGEDRARMVKEMMARVEVTLKELQKHAKKYEKLGDPSRSKKIWIKFKWSVDASELDSLRNKLVYHNGVISLLLTSLGNSSLQRIESTNLRLERRFSEIEGLIQKFEPNNSAPPGISAVSDKTSKVNMINVALMKNAEAGNRKWPAIGIDEWIQAGRWWLMKSQMNLSERSLSGETISRQGYLDLIKSSWILIDVIARHPQLNLLDSGIRYDMELLAETIRSELGNIDTLGLPKPCFEDLLKCDLQVWELQTRGPALQPMTHPGLASQLWATLDEHILFQRFGHYRANSYTKPAPCVVLFLVHRTDKMARIVLGNQSWIILEEFLGKVNPQAVENLVQIEQQNIQLSTPLDARHMCAVWEAAEEYIFHCERNNDELRVLQALTLLFAVKKNFQDVFEKLLIDNPNPASQACPSEMSFAARLWLATEDLGSRLYKEGSLEMLRGNYTSSSKSVFCWVAKEESDEVAMLLLEGKGVVTCKEDIRQWYSLHDAARDGKAEVLAFLLSEKMDVNKLDSALQIAVSEGHEAIVDKLLKAGADIDADFVVRNILDTAMGTALEVAIGGGHEAMVGKLLKGGADINANSGGALRAAARGGHEAIVDKLLKAGANINASFGGALEAAAEGGHEAIVGKLLKAGADINAGYKGVLRAAVEGGHEAIFDKLLKAGADINAHFGGALEAAAEGGHEAIVGKLLKAGADVNAHYGDVLRAAAKGGHEAIVGKLLKAGANINANYGSALRAAVEGGHEAIVDKLLKAGADINANFGRALQAAAEGGHEVIVGKLLKGGADINANSGGALEAAAKGGHEAIVDKLLKAGADINTNSTCVLQEVAEGGHEAIFDKLLKAGANFNTDSGMVLQAAVRGGHEAIVDKLLKAGADINANHGRALQAAAEGGHEAIVDKLLKAGADINANFGGALQAAAKGGHEAIVGKLLKAGADINANYGGALQAAAEGGHEAIVDKLLKAGADVNADSACVLQAAAEGGHEAIFDKLLKAGAGINANFGRALQAAAEGGHEAIVGKLLKASANINTDAEGLFDAMEAATRGGHEAIVDKLLNAGADVNAHSTKALKVAAMKGHGAIVDKLLKAGADVNAGFGNAFYEALEEDYARIVYKLLRANASDVNGSFEITALQVAIQGGHKEIVSMLYKAGARNWIPTHRSLGYPPRKDFFILNISEPYGESELFL